MSDEGEDDTSKTEDPTPKKLEEARKKGQVPISREINNWVMLTAATIVVLAMGPAMMIDLMGLMKTYIENAHNMPPMPGGMQFAVIEALKETLGIIALPLLFLLIAAFLGPFIQVGPLFAPDIIKFDIESFFERIGINSNLMMTRRNGLAAMVSRIKTLAGLVESQRTKDGERAGVA